MATETVEHAFRAAGRRFLELPTFSLRDLLKEVHRHDFTLQEIGDAIDLSKGHVGRLLRGQSMAIRESSLVKIYQMSGLPLKRLVYANAINSVSDDARALISDEPEVVFTDNDLELPEAAEPAASTDEDHGLGVTAWNHRTVIGYCKLRIEDYANGQLSHPQEKLVHYSTWELNHDHGELPSLGDHIDHVYVRVTSPLMEPSVGEPWDGKCPLPRGSIVEVDISATPKSGDIVWVQFEHEPADFYEFELVGRAGGEQGEIYHPRKRSYPSRVIRLPYKPGPASLHRCLIGVVLRIVEKKF